MDSTLPILPSSKLPIKRKTPSSPTAVAEPAVDTEPGSDPKNPPFKFHRIWTEPDEIRFLQGLVAGSSDNLVYPRDLNVFYTRFSNNMSQPYTKSQLSEKLRRLRKKFRVVSSRLVKGFDISLLSPHDQALYDLAKQLWHPDFAYMSPFNSDKSNKSGLVGVKVRFSGNVEHPGQDGITRNGVEFEGEEELREVNVELDRGKMGGKRVEVSRLDGPVRVGVVCGIGIGDIAAKVVMDVFDECLNEFRNGVGGERSDVGSFGSGVVGEKSNLGGFGNGVVGERSSLGGFGNGVVGERSSFGDFGSGVVGERSNVDGFGSGVVEERSRIGDFTNGVVGESSNLDGVRNGFVGERSNLGGFRNAVVGERSNVDDLTNGVAGERSNLGDFTNGFVGERSNVGDFTNGVVGEGSNLGGLLKEASSDKFEERWREQRVAELDLLARRMRLVLEHSLQRQ
ncbi:hypothetical protein BC332_13355 [Capsicum chinense]|nr:hypothetical protein BC332_13355 [Capsicum chinense]